MTPGREPLSPVDAERMMLVRGRLVLIWRCPWCTARQETVTDPPEHGAPRALAAGCRSCHRRFSVQPPEGEYPEA